MRKVLAVLLMLLVCSVYMIAIREPQQVLKESVEDQEEQTLGEQLQAFSNAIGETYPTTPKELIDAYNQVLGYEYSEKMEVELIEQVVEITRMFYSKHLLNLNSYETQVQGLTKEVIENTGKGIYMLGSQIDTIEFTQQDATIVTTLYETTTETIGRKYWIIQEDGRWKIHRWEDHVQ